MQDGLRSSCTACLAFSAMFEVKRPKVAYIVGPMLFELYKNTYRAFITIPSHFVGAFGVGCDSGRPEVAGVTPDVLPNINEVGRRGERDLFVCIWPNNINQKCAVTQKRSQPKNVRSVKMFAL